MFQAPHSKMCPEAENVALEEDGDEVWQEVKIQEGHVPHKEKVKEEENQVQNVYS